MILNSIYLFLLISSFEAYKFLSLSIKPYFIHVLYSKNDLIADEFTGWDEEIKLKFIDSYWQKRPVLIRSGIVPQEVLLFDRERLNYLIYDDDVQSRLYVKTKKGNRKTYGPFSDDDLEFKPNTKWSILIQVRLSFMLPFYFYSISLIRNLTDIIVGLLTYGLSILVFFQCGVEMTLCSLIPHEVEELEAMLTIMMCF